MSAREVGEKDFCDMDQRSVIGGTIMQEVCRIGIGGVKKFVDDDLGGLCECNSGRGKGWSRGI